MTDFAPIIQTQDLCRDFKDSESIVRAVDHVSMQIGEGERVAFIGPNGAGKSTTLKMLTGILYPTSGAASVAGFTPWQQRQKLAYHIGIVFGQRSQLWPHLPVIDSFNLLGKIYDLPSADFDQRRDRVCDILKIGHFLRREVRSLSLGQRMRCEIAASLLHAPKILFLDEPTIGLDITSRTLLREHLKHLAETSKTTIILTSHDTGDIEEICERVVLINHGKLLLDQPLVQLRRDFLKRKAISFVTEEETPNLDLAGCEVTRQSRHRLDVLVDTDHLSAGQVIAQAMGQLNIKDVAIENVPLETIIHDLYEQDLCKQNLCKQGAR